MYIDYSLSIFALGLVSLNHVIIRLGIDWLHDSSDRDMDVVTALIPHPLSASV